MTSLFRLIALPLTLFLTLTVSGCGGSGDSVTYVVPATYGKLTLTIVDGESDPLTGIADANILLLDATGNPVHNFTSTIDGTLTLQALRTGSYQLKVSANSFNPSPAPKVPPLPIQIVTNQTTDITITLYPHADAGSLGTITGRITNLVGNGVAGALVIANSGATSITTISATDGSYILHNVPAGTAELTAFLKSFNFLPITSDTVTIDGTTADQNIVADNIATGSFSGNLNPVAGAKVVGPVDITLLDPETREVIPGLRVYIDLNIASSYTMSGIPD
ncbi:MAG: carboxypeptidase regulatory-like domain-containing protein, partial [Gammaproteobacteria bacterium]|nr:carboxypeptidase regulatory-like domain-containing protein [Gammaproteobacteria bacterium]